jgi:drug/metabolite transporter (DMT)-like permease
MPAWAGDGLALTCALSWGVSVLLFRKLASVDADAVNLFKNTTASVLLLITMAIMGVGFDTSRSTSDWLILGASGILGLAIADTLFLAGLRRIDASIAAVTDCVYSPSVILVSTLWLGRSCAWASGWAGRSWSSGSCWFSLRSKLSKPPDGVGVALALAGVVTTAVGGAGEAGARQELARGSHHRSLVVRLYRSFLVSDRERPGEERFGPVQASADLAPRDPAMLLGTYVSMLLWLGGMKYGTPSRTALLNQMGAIFVLLFSRFLLGEAVPRRRWAGAIVAVSGVVAVLVL